jgi:hypothetical protein
MPLNKMLMFVVPIGALQFCDSKVTISAPFDAYISGLPDYGGKGVRRSQEAHDRG